MRPLMVICVLTVASTMSAEEPKSPSNSKLPELRQAVRLLEQAGEGELAERVHQRIAEQKQAGRERLDKLRKQRDELTLEIDRLARELELAADALKSDRPAVLLHVNMFRVDLDQLRVRHPELAEELLTEKEKAPLLEAVGKLVDLPNPPKPDAPFCATDVSETLRLPIGEKVTSFSGGEILIPVSATHQETREIGTRVTATINRHEDGDWQGNLRVNHVVADYSHTAEAADGTLIPGLHCRCIETNIKAREREPQVIAALPLNEEGKHHLMLVMIVLEPEDKAQVESP